MESLAASGPIIGMKIAYGHVIDTMKLSYCQEPGPDSLATYKTMLQEQLAEQGVLNSESEYIEELQASLESEGIAVVSLEPDEDEDGAAAGDEASSGVPVAVVVPLAVVFVVLWCICIGCLVKKLEKDKQANQIMQERLEKAEKTPGNTGLASHRTDDGQAGQENALAPMQGSTLPDIRGKVPQDDTGTNQSIGGYTWTQL